MYEIVNYFVSTSLILAALLCVTFFIFHRVTSHVIDGPFDYVILHESMLSSLSCLDEPTDRFDLFLYF